MRDFESGGPLPDPSDLNVDPPMDEIVIEYDAYTSFGSRVIDTNLLLRTVGDIDLYSSAVMKQLILDQLADHPEISQAEIDLTKTEYIDSTVLGVLVALARKLGAGKPDRKKAVRIITSSRNMSELFEITKLRSVFELIDTLEENN